MAGGLSAYGAAGLNRKRGPRPDDLGEAQACIAELERLAGRQQADLAFFREALRSWDAKRRGSGAPISSVIETMIARGMIAQGPQGETRSPVDIVHLCRIAGLSRESFYRRREPNLGKREDADGDYAARLAARGLARSMSRPGNPYDNAKAESFMKTLKAEEVDGRA